MNEAEIPTPKNEVEVPPLATVYRGLPCPKCGRQYSEDVTEASRFECCGHALPLEPVVILDTPETPSNG